jgi:Phage-related lysozyme (muraminidase)
MTSIADNIAAALRPIAPDKELRAADVPLINQLAAQWAARSAPATVPAPDAGARAPIETIRLTARGAAELIGHEAIVLEWYRDSEGVGTWGIGVTDASGHRVGRYKDNPQPIARCIEVYLWLLDTHYIPDVRRAFGGCQLTEAQFAAAISFHYNTGAILRTDWVKLFKAGKMSQAQSFLEGHYLNGGDLAERRKKEAALFFDGVWSGDGTTTVWPVRKPSYTPAWGKGERVDVMPYLREALP